MLKPSATDPGEPLSVGDKVFAVKPGSIRTADRRQRSSSASSRRGSEHLRGRLLLVLRRKKFRKRLIGDPPKRNGLLKGCRNAATRQRTMNWINATRSGRGSQLHSDPSPTIHSLEL